MPELPEVEHFRQLMLPLVVNNEETSSHSVLLKVECPSATQPKNFPTNEELQFINKYPHQVKDVLRKGKLLCIVLQNMKTNQSKSTSLKIEWKL